MKTIPLKIPVKPHIKSFLVFHFGNNYEFSNDDFLGVFLRYMLTKQSNYKVRQPNNYYKSSFHITIPGFAVFEHGFDTFLTPKSILDFNQFFDSLFRWSFYSSIVFMLNYHPKTIKDALVLFTSIIDISENDLPLETLVKSFFRFRKSEKHPLLKLYHNPFENSDMN